MGNKIIIYKQKVKDNLKESYKHLSRLNKAFTQLEKSYYFGRERVLIYGEYEMILKKSLFSSPDPKVPNNN